jgi:3-phenylpropionate/trans-cinnamate dioxygenase ferredoxin reductase component
MTSTVAIIGAGQAGLQVAASLRELQFAGRVVLVGDEPHLPYQRPPLSKGYLLGEAQEAQLHLRPGAFFEKFKIELRTGRRALAIDRTRKLVGLDDASVVAYDQLVLATGARNRPLPVPGADLINVFYLRTLDESSALRASMAAAKSVVVIGAGFIGLEFAAAARKQGLSVTVLDVAQRPMARALSRTMSSLFQREHEKLGVELRFGAQVSRLVGELGRVRAVELGDGTRLAADLVVVGIGVIPNVELAAGCELEIDDGIAVDQHLQTSDPSISAIGDVAAHVNHHARGRRVRLESVQNASDQARCIAQRIVGKPAPYQAVPWFWSHQAHLKLQMAGLPSPGCEEVLRGDPDAGSCSVFLFCGGTLVCVESLNRAADHMLARRLLASDLGLTPEQAADSSFDLKSLLAKAS